MRTIHNQSDAPDKDEYYTLRETADEVAAYVKKYVSLDTPIDCPADTLDSEIPLALSRAGFTDVSFYADLPYEGHDSQVREGAVIVTNPPFSMRSQFSAWLRADKLRKFVVCCTLVDFPTYGGGSIPELSLHKNFKRPDGSIAGVAVTWVANFGYALYPRLSVLKDKAKGFCMICKNKTCTLQGSDTVLYTVNTAAKAGGVYSFCNRYQEVTTLVSFGRVFLTGGAEPTIREKDRRA